MCQRLLVCTLLATGMGCVSAAPAFGAGDDGGQFVALGMKTGAMLALTLALLLLISCILKRWNLFGTRIAGGRRRMRIIDSLYLAPKNSLAIVRVDDQDILVGITPSSISHLASLPPHQDDASGAYDSVPECPGRLPGETVARFVRQCRGFFKTGNGVPVMTVQDVARSRSDHRVVEKT